MSLGYGFGYDLASCPGMPPNYGMTGNNGYNGGAVNNYAPQQQSYADSFTARGNIAPYKREPSEDSSGKTFTIGAVAATVVALGAMALKALKRKP